MTVPRSAPARPGPAGHGVPSLPDDPLSVAFATSRRPEGATLVHVAEFEGPLGLLLALIESRRLDVLTVPLGALAEAYLDALATLEADRMGNIATFVAVAGQLIVIKSRALLPRAPGLEAPGGEEVDPEEDLRRRLLVFRAYRDAARALAERVASGGRLFRREPAAAVAAGAAGARPSPVPPLDVAVLVDALAALLRVAPPPPEPPGMVARTITLADRATVIRAALRSAPIVVLQDLLGGSRDKVVIAVTFLALLELVKRREVTAEQAEPWGPIMIRRR